MEDNCVYARNLLGRLVSTYGGSRNQQYSQSQTTQPDASCITPAAMMIIAAVLLLLFASLQNRKKKAPQSKIE